MEPRDVITIIGWAVGAVGIVGSAILAFLVQRARVAMREMVASDREVQLSQLGQMGQLDHAYLRERCDEAARAGQDACVALVRKLGEEAARRECAACTAHRVEIRRIQDARIADLHELLPAVKEAATAQNSAATAMRELAAALREAP